MNERVCDRIDLAETLPATAQAIYDTWLSSEGHTAMTGADADLDASEGGQHSAWDGYIEGTFVALEPERRIVMTWRTSEFAPDAPDSQVEVVLEDTNAGCVVTLVHTELPEGDGPRYEQGWRDYYFTPMRAYFAGAR